MKRTKDKLYKRLSNGRGRQPSSNGSPSTLPSIATNSETSSTASSEKADIAISEPIVKDTTRMVDIKEVTTLVGAESAEATTDIRRVKLVSSIKEPSSNIELAVEETGKTVKRPDLQRNSYSAILPSSARSPSRPSSRPQSRASSRGSSRASSRGPAASATLKRTSHSYGRLYSSTNLKELSGTGMVSPTLNMKQKAITDSTLLLRAGSKLWEESRETRGQSWLRDDYESNSSSEEEEDSNGNSNSNSNANPNANPNADSNSGTVETSRRSRRSSYALGHQASGNDSDVENEKELVFYFRRKVHYEGSEAEESTSSLSNTLSSESGSVGVYVLHAVDWILGIKQESPSGFAESLKHTYKQPLTQHEKMLLRDEEHYSPVDLAWVLALVSGSGFL